MKTVCGFEKEGSVCVRACVKYLFEFPQGVTPEGSEASAHRRQEEKMDVSEALKKPICSAIPCGVLGHFKRGAC